MKSLIKALGDTEEFILVMFIAFGYSIYLSNYSLFYHLDHPIQDGKIVDVTGGDIGLIIRCITILLVAWYILNIRGYKLGDFNFSFSWRQLGIAFLLYYLTGLVTHIAFYCVKIGAREFYDALLHAPHTKQVGNVMVGTILLFVDPIKEEFFLSGYVFKRLEKLKPSLVILISVAIRISYHTYQGWDCLFFTLPFGLVLSLYYSRYKKIWPVIMAHILNNSFVYIHHLTQN